MLTAYANDLEEALAKAFNVRFKTRPLMGTLPLGKANAAVIRVPFMNEFIVVFHHGLFAFVNLLSKVVAAAIGMPEALAIPPGTYDHVFLYDGGHYSEVLTNRKTPPTASSRASQWNRPPGLCVTGLEAYSSSAFCA